MSRFRLTFVACALGLVGGALHVPPAAANDFTALLDRAESLLRRVAPQASRRHIPSSGFEPWLELAQQAADKYAMPLPLVLAVMEVESGFDPYAVSPKGAHGLMQVMPETARDLGIDPGRLFDPEVNVDAGVRYLRFLANRYDGHTRSVLAAYNAAPARFRSDAPPPREAIEYVDRVGAAYSRYAFILRSNMEAEIHDAAIRSHIVGGTK